MIELKEKNVTAATADDDVAIACPVAVAVAVDVDVASPGVGLRLNHEIIPTSTIELGEKQGSKFCGFCCDLRRAVIILAIVAIVVYSISAILTLAVVQLLGFLEFGVVVILLMPILFFVFQLVAAMKYNVCMLVTAVVFQCVSLIVGLYFYDSLNPIVSIALWALFVYPTVGLILEIKKGIMSKENYPREAYCCCNI